MSAKLGPDVSLPLGYAVRASRRGFTYTYALLLSKMLPDWGTEKYVSFHFYLTVKNTPYAAQSNEGTVVPNIK